MPYTDTQVANLALVRVGEERIAKLDSDEGKPARECRAIYEPFRDEVLQLFGWPFAKARAALSQSSTSPAFGFDYAYVLPTDLISILSVQEDPVYTVESGELLTNREEDVNLHYIRREKDPTKFSPAFVKVFYLRMAMTLAMTLARSRALYLEIKREYEEALSEARAVDSWGNVEDKAQPSSYVDART